MGEGRGPRAATRRQFSISRFVNKRLWPSQSGGKAPSSQRGRKGKVNCDYNTFSLLKHGLAKEGINRAIYLFPMKYNGEERRKLIKLSFHRRCWQTAAGIPLSGNLVPCSNKKAASSKKETCGLGRVKGYDRFSLQSLPISRIASDETGSKTDLHVPEERRGRRGRVSPPFSFPRRKISTFHQRLRGSD